MDTSRYDIAAAGDRIRRLALRTPLLPSGWLAEHTGCEVGLKLECLQRTGSFKLRGAANHLLARRPERGVVACSSGNHGLATAFVAARLGLPAHVCVPEWADPVKVAAIRGTGAHVHRQGDTMEAAEAESLRLRDAEGLDYVHPFDDPLVIAGQGTVGAEISEQMPDVTTVVVPLSGGGLVAGVGLALAAAPRPGVRVVAVSAAAAPVMARSVAAGRLVELPEQETLASALAGNLGPTNEHTLALVSELVDDHVEVSEAEIAAAMVAMYREHRLVVEGGGAVGVAALLAGRVETRGSVVVVVSGGNVDLTRLAELARTD